MKTGTDGATEERQDSLDFWNLQWRQSRAPIEEHDPFSKAFDKTSWSQLTEIGP
jgi:hypothetical protein